MSETLTPVFRLEYFITAAANGTPCDLEPIFNEEKYLHAIAGASVDLPMPIGRTQEYLAKLAGMDVEIPDKPIYRTEYYLAHMIDSTVECPAPVFREEMFYYEWASNEYVTIVGNPVTFSAIAAPLKQLQIAFSPVQDLHGYDSPWPAGGGANKINPQDFSEWATVTGDVIYFDGSIASSGANTIRVPFAAQSGETVTVIIVSADNSSYVCRPKFFDGNTQVYDAGNYSKATPYAVSVTLNGDVDTFSVGIKTDISAGVLEGKVKIAVVHGTATAWTPYSNECPISGWDGVTVWRTGKNLFDKTQVVSAYIDSSNKIIYADDFKSVYIQLKPNVTYTLSQTVLSAWANRAALVNSLTANEATYHPITKTAGKAAYSDAYTLTFTNTDFKYLLVSNYRASADGDNFDAIEDSCQLELGDTATEFVPYNPASRAVSVEFPVVGTNRWDEEWVNAKEDIDPTTGEIKPPSGTYWFFRSKNFIPVQPATTYFDANGMVVGNYRKFFYDAEKNFISYISSASGTTFTTPANARYMLFRFTSSDGTVYGNNISINYPATVTAYSPHTNTAYSGYVDLVTGVATVDHAAVDMGTLTWAFYSEKFYAEVSGRKPTAVNTNPNLICSNYKTGSTVNVNATGTPDKTIMGRTNRGDVMVHDSAYSTVEAFTAAMNGVTVVYELATPIEIQLTPEQVNSLAGENVMWSNANQPITVEYRKN